MSNPLARWSRGLIEACWLALIVATPLFFNIYSDRVFEADKTAVVRSIAWLMVAGWMVNWVARQGWRQFDRNAWRKQPLLLLLALLALVYLITTATAILPSVSWTGNYRRLQGTYTMLAYIAISAIMLTTMTQVQLRRAVTTFILTSVPVVLYALVQRLGLDPVPWSGGWTIQVQLRVIGTLGQPIFMAAYLAFVFPLTLVRVIEWGQKRQWLATGLYAVLLMGQSIAIIWTSSRGPLLALVMGMAVFGVVGLLLWRSAGGLSDQLWLRLWGVGIAGAVLLIGFLVLFNLSPSVTDRYEETPILGSVFDTLDEWRTLPVIGRFGQLSETTVGSGRVRILIWAGVVDLISPHDPIPFATGETDSLNGIRWLVGYGADSLQLVYGPFYRPEIGSIEVRNPRIDRAHNEVLDVVAMTGVLGLIAWQGLFIGVVVVACQQLGLVTTRRDWFFLVAMWLVGGAILAFALTASRGSSFVGLGFGIGNVLGFGLFLLTRVRRGVVPRPGQALYLLAFLSIIITHYVELQVGIPIVTTRLYFFLFVPLIAIAGRPMPEEEPVRKPSKKRKQPSFVPPVLPLALLLSLIMGILGYVMVLFPAGFVITDHTPISAIAHILQLALYGSAPVVHNFLFGTWFICFWLIWAEVNEGKLFANPMALLAVLDVALGIVLIPAFGWGLSLLLIGAGLGYLFVQWQNDWRAIVIPAGIISIMPLITCFVMAFMQVLAFQQSAVAPAGVNLRIFEAEQAAGFFSTHIVLILLLTIALATALWFSENKERRSKTTPIYGWITALAVIVISGIAIKQTNIDPIRADVIHKQSLTLRSQAEQSLDPAWLETAIEVFEHTLTIMPNEALYHSELGLTYTQLATTRPDSTEIWQAAQAELATAQALNPLHVDIAHNSARFHSTWGQNTTEAQRAEQVRLAGEAYEGALRLSPQSYTIWNEYARLSFVLGEDCAHTQSLYNRAIQADEFAPDSYIGLAAVQYNCLDGEKSAVAFAELIQLVQEGINRIATATNPAGFAQIASQYNDLDTFNAALREYELGRVEQREQIQGLLNEATTALNENDLLLAETHIQEAITLSQAFLLE